MADIETGGPAEEIVRDSGTAPTILVDGIYGLQMREGVAQVNFSRHVFPAPGSDLGEPYNDVVLRMAISTSGFVRIADWFQNSKQKMIDAGIVIVPPPENGEDGG